MTVCLRVGHTAVPYKKTAEPVVSPFARAESREPNEPCIRWGQGQSNPFAAAKCEIRRCGLLPNYSGRLSLHCTLSFRRHWND